MRWGVQTVQYLGCGLDDQGILVQFLVEAEDFCFTECLDWLPTLPPSVYVPGALPLGVKWQSNEADSPHLYNAKEECMKPYPLLPHMP